MGHKKPLKGMANYIKQTLALSTGASEYRKGQDAVFVCRTPKMALVPMYAL